MVYFAVQPGTRYWTGVFTNQDTPDSIYTKTPSPNIIHWLVSGNTTTYTAANPTGGPSILPADTTYAVGPGGAVRDPAKAVVLVGKNSVGSAADSTERYVAVPLVEVLGKDSAKPVARFAWWVGDEGVKASINRDKTLDDKTNYAALTAQRRGWETVAGFSSYPAPSPGSRTSLSKVITPGETGLLIPSARAPGDGASPLQNVFHSATTDSRAVLSDTLRGGTRIDLTAILADTLPSSKAVSTIPNYPVKNSNIIPPCQGRHQRHYHARRPQVGHPQGFQRSRQIPRRRHAYRQGCHLGHRRRHRPAHHRLPHPHGSQNHGQSRQFI
jgi:hypothetical protein